MKTAAPIWCLSLLVFCVPIHGADESWDKIKSCFEPPAEFAGEFGRYRSPLKFDDGQNVRTPEDWARRRTQIQKRWHDVMGPWPALIEKPKVEFLDKSERETVVQHRIRVQISADRMLEGYLLIPKDNSSGRDSKGSARRPAVLVSFYEPQTSIGQAPAGKGEFRDFAWQLARRGFVTLAIGSPGGDARKPDKGQAVCQPLAYLGYISANCANALANMPEVDPGRIGVAGHSYGGKWAMFASCLSERFAAAAWSDPGIVFDEARPNVNYWEPWYLGLDPSLPRQRKPGILREDSPRTGAYKTMIEKQMDLHELHALMAPRPFLVSGGSEDPPQRWIPLNHSIAVNRLLGQTHRVGMHNRKDHSPNADSNEIIYAFFEHFLKK